MAIEDLVCGAEAARMFGVARPESVWRAARRHGADYPGRIEVIAVGRGFAARRDELAAFAAWYRANVHRDTRPDAGRKSPAGEPRQKERRDEAAERRRALQKAIRFIQEKQEESYDRD